MAIPHGGRPEIAQFSLIITMAGPPIPAKRGRRVNFTSGHPEPQAGCWLPLVGRLEAAHGEVGKPQPMK